MLKAAAMAADTAEVMDTLPLHIHMLLHTRTVRHISLSMHSRRTAMAAESVSDLGTITTVETAGITEVMAGIIVGMVVTMVGMVVTTVDMAVTMVDMAVTMVGIAVTTVDTTDITESMEVNGLFGLVRLGKCNLPSLPDKS